MIMMIWHVLKNIYTLNTQKRIERIEPKDSRNEVCDHMCQITHPHWSPGPFVGCCFGAHRQSFKFLHPLSFNLWVLSWFFNLYVFVTALWWVDRAWDLIHCRGSNACMPVSSKFGGPIKVLSMESLQDVPRSGTDV